MKTHLLLALITALLVSSCRKDEVVEPGPVQMTTNGNLETGSGFPTSWFGSNGSDGTGKYNVEWSTEYAYSGTRSIKISSDVPVSDSFAYWGQQNCTEVPKGKRVALKTLIKSELVGAGVSIAIRCDSDPGSVVDFISSEGKTSITGTFDWKEYSIEIAEVPESTKCILIYLVYLQNTTGDVYFDDVSLVHY